MLEQWAIGISLDEALAALGHLLCYLVVSIAPSGEGRMIPTDQRGIMQSQIDKAWLDLFPDTPGFQNLDGSRNRHFDFLFKLLLGLAVSRRDIDRLHELLPENGKLPRSYFTGYKDFWDKWFKAAPLRTKPRSTLANEQVHWIIDPLTAHVNLCLLYLEILIQKKPKVDIPQKTLHHRRETPAVSFCFDVTLAIFGSLISEDHFSLAIADDHKTIFVHALLDATILTESLSHRILTELPSDISFQRRSRKTAFLTIPIAIEGVSLEDLVLLDPKGRWENHTTRLFPVWVREHLIRMSNHLSFEWKEF